MDHRDLDLMIDSLKESITNAQFSRTQGRPIWDEIKNINAAFKQTRYPTHEEQQCKWDRFQSLVQQVKEQQGQARRDDDRRASLSQEKLKQILAAAKDATPICPIYDHMDDLLTFGLASFARVALDIDTDERLVHLKDCSCRIKAAWALLEEHKREMLGRDKAEAFQALKEAQESLGRAWEQWKSWQSEQRQLRMAHKREKREAWEGQVRERIANHNERRERLYGVLSHKECHLDELKEKFDSARTDEFRARVAGWMDEETESIAEIRNKLEDIERWIDEEKAKLR